MDAYLRSTYLVAALALVAVTALAQAPRLWDPLPPGGPFALTWGLGLSASVGALYVVVRFGAQAGRLLVPRRRAPEVPLVPTLWCPGADLRLPIARLAAANGWIVRSARGRRAEDTTWPWDGSGIRGASDRTRSSPRRDLLFRLQRRLHVVLRRVLFRRLHSLFKEVTARPRPPGVGYLLCPHVWPVPAIVRDTSGAETDGTSRSAVGGMLVGRPYSAVFPLRVRRYLGGAMRHLDLDAIWWEDGVRWSDLRAVLGVLLETWDQGRGPARDLHFVGIPRVAVHVQEPEDLEAGSPHVGDEDDEQDAGKDGVAGSDAGTSPGSAPGVDGEEGPPPLRARALVIRRDGGGREAEAREPAPGVSAPVFA